MGEDTTPEIPIPMPEPPLPGAEYSAPLTSYFPFGVIDHVIFSTLDAVIEGKLWPSCPVEQEELRLWHYFPFGPPAQMIISIVDLICSLIQAV